MKTTMLTLAVLFALSGAARAAGHECACHPAPPPPPLPPMSLNLPAPPAPPVPPAPPAPPALPALPASVHAACAGQPEGFRVTLSAGKRVTITGVCEKQGESMVFDLREYRRG